jgi:hypothetical protein
MFTYKKSRKLTFVDNFNCAKWSYFANLKADLITNFRTANCDIRLCEQFRLRTLAKDGWPKSSKFSIYEVAF